MAITHEEFVRRANAKGCAHYATSVSALVIAQLDGVLLVSQPIEQVRRDDTEFDADAAARSRFADWIEEHIR